MLMRKYFICAVLGLVPLFTGFSQEIYDVVRSGEMKTLKKMLDKDPALINSRDLDQNTPLHAAVEAGKMEAAALLLKKGADIEAVNVQVATPLHVAANKGNPEAVKLLLERGADPAKREMRDRTPLFLAANWGNDLETVRLLVDAGSDVNFSNSRRENLLVSILFYGKKEIIDFLIDRGAVLPDDENTLWRSLYVSASNGNERTFNMAKDKLTAMNREWWRGVPMNACARGGSVTIGEALAANGAPLGARDRYGVEPIHIAAENGRTEFVEFLLAKGASIDSPSLTGKTAYHFALENGHQDLAGLLVSKGASQEPAVFPTLNGDYLGQKAPGESPEIFAPGIVSTHGFESEHSPCVFSPDLKEVYWTKKFRGPIMTMKQVEGVWTSPESASFCSEYGDGEPVFSPDGKKLFFLSFRPVQQGGPHDKENMWFVERIPEGWSEPKPVSPRINAMDIHWSFSVTDNGTIYFASTSGNTLGQNDIFRSRLAGGEYAEPENLGPVINTAGVDHTPYIARDESCLIYVTAGESPNPMAWRFHISLRNPDGSWTKPVDMGDKVNSIPQALCPVLTPDGKYIFLVGAGDIYWMDAKIIEEMKESL